MALAGHQTSLKIAGAAVAVTNEACSSISGANPNKLYQVTSSSRRIWDPDVAIVVKDGGVTVSSTLYTFDYLFGFIQFAGHTQTGAITVDGSYLPTAAIAEINSFEFQGSADLLDSTVFESGGARQKTTGLVDGSGSFNALSHPSRDYDATTGGTQSLHADLLSGTAKLLEASFGSGASILRAWVMIENLSVGASIDGLVESSWNFQTAPKRAGASVAFGS